MPLRPLDDVLADLDRAEASGAMPPGVAYSRRSWAEENAQDGNVNFPEDWLTYDPDGKAPTARTVPPSAPLRQPAAPAVDAPGEGIASFLGLAGWATIALGCLGAFFQIATPAVAITTAITSVVGGALLLAAGVAIQLLRQIALRS